MLPSRIENTPREPELVEVARREPSAFAELYRAHYRVIVAYLFRRTGDRHTAEDLACETFIAAYRGIGKYRARGLPFRAWLYRIATNEANTWAAKRGKLKVVPLAEAEGKAGAGGGGEGTKGGVEAAQWALLRLSPEHQAVLTLHYVEELPLEQVALVLGKRLGTIKSRLFRAREEMRRVIEESEAGHG